jgi:hypothetical protein
LVQAFLKKWWVESDFKAPNPPLSSLNSDGQQFHQYLEKRKTTFQIIGHTKDKTYGFGNP